AVRERCNAGREVRKAHRAPQPPGPRLLDARRIRKLADVVLAVTRQQPALEREERYERERFGAHEVVVGRAEVSETATQLGTHRVHSRSPRSARAGQLAFRG